MPSFWLHSRRASTHQVVARREGHVALLRVQPPLQRRREILVTLDKLKVQYTPLPAEECPHCGKPVATNLVVCVHCEGFLRTRDEDDRPNTSEEETAVAPDGMQARAAEEEPEAFAAVSMVPPPYTDDERSFLMMTAAEHGAFIGWEKGIVADKGGCSLPLKGWAAQVLAKRDAQARRSPERAEPPSAGSSPGRGSAQGSRHAEALEVPGAQDGGDAVTTTPAPLVTPTGPAGGLHPVLASGDGHELAAGDTSASVVENRPGGGWSGSSPDVGLFPEDPFRDGMHPDTRKLEPLVQTYATREDWLASRGDDCGASEAIDCLQDAEGSPVGQYGNRYSLYAKKVFGEEPFDNEKMKAGRYLEPSVAQWAADELELSHEMNGLTRYRHSTLPLAATPDAWLLHQNGRREGMEIKTTSMSGDKVPRASGEGPITDVFPGEDHGIPLGYEVQVQSSLLCCGGDSWVLAILAWGSRLSLFRIHRDDAVCDWIARSVTETWAMIEARTPPHIVLGTQLEHVQKAVEAGNRVTLDEAEAAHVVKTLEEAAADRKQAEAVEGWAKAKLLAHMGGEGTSEPIAGRVVTVKTNKWGNLQVRTKAAK